MSSRDLVGVFCANCEKKFSREIFRVLENKKFGHKLYCSKKCQYQAHITRVVLVCNNLECRKVFEKQRNDVTEFNYCSRSCAAIVNNIKFPKWRPAAARFCKTCNSLITEEKILYCSKSCKSAGLRAHSSEELLYLIKKLSRKLNRVPTRRDAGELSFQCMRVFGSWNDTLKRLGMQPYRSHENRMYRRTRTIAQDGHRCDSVSEALIDNWMTENNIVHEKDLHYPTINHKADWRLQSNVFVEYFGLANDSPRYDRSILEKRKICKRLGITLVELYPNDLYPDIFLDNKLSRFLNNARVVA